MVMLVMVSTKVYDIFTGIKEILSLLLINAMAVIVWYLTGQTYVLMLAFLTDAWTLDKNLDIMKKIAVSFIEGKELARYTFLKELGLDAEEIAKIIEQVKKKVEGDTTNKKAEVRRVIK